jgi:ABC-type branched-subunit amino acid transport system permease subunit
MVQINDDNYEDLTYQSMTAILEDLIAEFTVYWQFYVGWVLLAVVLFAPRGLAGLRWPGRRR